MKDEAKSKEELIEELRELRRRNALLESAEQACRREEETLELEMSRLLSVYDNVDELIYVSDPLTYEVLYVNKFGREFLHKDPVGSFCFSVFEDRDSPCPFCPNEEVLKKADSSHRWEREIAAFGRYFRITDRIIQWPDGRDAKLEVTTDISELKKTEEELRQSKERYRTVVESSFDGILIQKDRLIWFANSKLHAMLGYREHELDGQDYLVIFHPDDRDLIRSRSKARIAGETVPSQYEIRLQHREGEIIDAEVDARLVRLNGEPGVHFCLRDISARKRAEVALRESEERYRMLTENSLTGIYIHKDGKFLFVNDRLAEMHGCTPDEMIGKQVLDFVHPDDRKLVMDTFRSQESDGNGATQYVFRGLSRDGAVKWLHILATTLESAEETANMGNVQDITDRKAMEEELLNKIRTIDELYEHVVQSRQVKAITEHTANVAHELRQPLAIIGGFARRLEKDCVVCERCDKSKDPSQLDSFQIVINEVKRLEQILGALIDYSRREGVSMMSVNPHKLIDYVLDIYRGRLNEKNLLLEKHFGDEVGKVNLDQSKFQQVVRNLVANAIEASLPDTTILVETGLSMPSERARKAGRLDSSVYFEMKIGNSGEAIPKRELEKIFNPFYTTKDYAGGLGLTLSRKIVRDHGGSISVKSDNEGTVFTVWLPVIDSLAVAGSAS